MKNILNRLEYNIFDKYNLSLLPSKPYEEFIWDYRITQDSVDGISQLEHNESLCCLILENIKKYNLNVIIVSGCICEIFFNYERFHLINHKDVNNYQRYKKKVKTSFLPMFLIKGDGGENIGLVIQSNIKIKNDNIIITNSNGDYHRIMYIRNLPTVNLLDLFNKNNG